MPKNARLAIQEELYDFLTDHADVFNAPYGILKGVHVNYYNITFGIAGRVDAEIHIYNPKWLLYRDSRANMQKFKTLAALRAYLEETYLN